MSERDPLHIEFTKEELAASLGEFTKAVITPAVDELAERYKTEMQLLRDFYEKWVKMHAIKTDDLHMNKKKMAAQEMWDQAQRLKNLYLTTRTGSITG